MRTVARHVITALGLLALAAARPLLAQSASIDSAMTREQVVERLGAPASERSSGARTYLFYQNGCERTCGMHDLVVLEDGVVIDAIFRSPARRYTGRSSSPVAVPPARGRGATAGSGAAPARAASRSRAKKPEPARAALPSGTKAGGIVTGGDITGGAGPVPARTTGVAGAAGAAAAQGAQPGAANAGGARDDARQTRTLPGPVRVPSLPRDTLLPPPPGERGQRTLPGPAKVPTLPRDTSVARPDSARPKPPARPDSTPRS